MERYVTTGPVIEDIYEQSIDHRSVLLVFQSVHEAYGFNQDWRNRYPHVPVPKYVTVANTLPARGRYCKAMWIFGVDQLPDGWADEKLMGLIPCVDPDGTLTYVYETHEWSLRSHTYTEPTPEPLPPAVVKAGFLRRYFKGAKPVSQGH